MREGNGMTTQPIPATHEGETKVTTLADHDLKVKPHLEWIGAGAAMAARHARAIPHKMAFTTHAEDELAEAREVLETALQNIIAAQAIYAGKPLEMQAAE